MTESLRPTIRVQNRRTKAWIELPDEIPGLATGLVKSDSGKIVPIEVPIESIEYWARLRMAQYDNLCPEDRWKESYLSRNSKTDLTTPPRWIGRRRAARAKTSDITNLF